MNKDYQKSVLPIIIGYRNVFFVQYRDIFRYTIDCNQEENQSVVEEYKFYIQGNKSVADDLTHFVNYFRASIIWFWSLWERCDRD